MENDHITPEKITNPKINKSISNTSDMLQNKLKNIGSLQASALGVLPNQFKDIGSLQASALGVLPNQFKDIGSMQASALGMLQNQWKDMEWTRASGMDMLQKKFMEIGSIQASALGMLQNQWKDMEWTRASGMDMLQKKFMEIGSIQASALGMLQNQWKDMEWTRTSAMDMLQAQFKDTNSIGISALNSLQRQFDKSKWDSNSLKTIIDSMANFDLSLDAKMIDKLHINEDGSSAADALRITTTQVDEKLIAVINSSIGEATDQFDTTVNRLINEIRNLKDTRLEKIIWNIIIPFIFLLFSIFLSTSIKITVEQKFSLTNKQIREVIIKRIKDLEIIDIDMMKLFRLVGTNELEMRAKKSIKSQTIYTLHRGQVVELIEKRRNWSLVSINNEDLSEKKQGWVFSRYLIKVI